RAWRWASEMKTNRGDGLRLIDLMALTATRDTRNTEPVNDNIRHLIVAGITSDSRHVKPGYLFAALPGKKDDGKTYIEDAIANGAVAIVAQPGTELPKSAGGVVLIEDPNPRRRFARM